MRVAVIFDNFGPYHVARLASAARAMDVVAVEVLEKSAVYDWYRPNMPGTMTHIFLGAKRGNGGSSWRDYTRMLDDKLKPLRPDAIAVSGWASLASLAAAAWARRRDIPVIVMSETTPWDFTRSRFAFALKRRLMQHYSAALCGARSHKDYLVSLGLPAEAVFLGYDAVDNDYFSSRAKAAKAGIDMPDIGAGKRLPGAARGRYFLACARFIEKKNLRRLIEAYNAFRRGRGADAGDWPLVILGDGKLRTELEGLIDSLGLAAYVHLPGFRQYAELPEFYGAAGVFIHASTTEQWGLVVNEAMASGLPVIVSHHCGCAAELVQEGVNGVTFDPFDVAGLSALMQNMAGETARAAMGAASQRIVSDWGPDRFAAGLKAAAEYALSRGAPKFNRADTLLIRGVAERQNRVRNHPSD